MFIALAVLLMLVGCSTDSAEDLAAQVHDNTLRYFADDLLPDVVVTPTAGSEERFDVVVSIPLGTSFENSQARDATPDDLRLTNYAFAPAFVRDYQRQGFDQDIGQITLHFIHPESHEVLIEIDIPPTLRSSLMEDIADAPDDIPTLRRAGAGLPTTSDRYEDRLEDHHYDEIIEFWKEWFGITG